MAADRSLLFFQQPHLFAEKNSWYYRYNIPDMRALSESMLQAKASNWRDLLRASELLQSTKLRVDVLALLQNYDTMEDLKIEEGDEEGQDEMALEFPELQQV